MRCNCLFGNLLKGAGPVFLTLALFSSSPAKAGELRVTKDRAPSLAVLPADNKEVAATAGIFRDYVREITGAELPGADLWSGQGILLALTTSLPESEQELAGMLREKPLAAYGYNITGERAVIAGNSPKALRDGVYALLEQFGCRWLVPSKRWTVIPKQTQVVFPVQKRVYQPDFTFRSIWYAYGVSNRDERLYHELEAAYKTWCDANRLGGVIKYKIGHTYASTVGRHEAQFREHPEYFAMAQDGSRLPFTLHQSLCYSNPQVARFFVEDKLAELRADRQVNPHCYVVSMDPNDSSKECFCEKCKKLGNGSDQALHLANQVARALRREFSNAVVTMYAYASHRLPPEKSKAEPNVEVQVAMGFNRTQYTLEQLVSLWMEKVATVGIRDYFGVMAWDWGLPGRGKASSYKYVSENLPKYHAWGARSFNTEINANWASFGPACYLATKLLWNTGSNSQAVYDDFFDLGFGKAAAETKELYAMFSQSSDLTPQNIHGWLKQLDKAFHAASGEEAGARQRLIDLTAFLHYAILYRQWELGRDSNDQEKAYTALRPLLEFTWRIRDRNMVHAYALQRRLVNSGHEKLRPLRAGWKFSDPQAVWKHPDLLSDEELVAIFQKNLRDHLSDPR